MNKVFKFKFVSQVYYDNLAPDEREDRFIYVTDTGKMYKGNLSIKGSIIRVTELPEKGESDIIYVLSKDNTNGIYIYDDTVKWISIIDAVSQEPFDDSKVQQGSASIESTKKYISDKLSTINDRIDSVKFESISINKDKKYLYLNNIDGSQTELDLSSLFSDLTIDTSSISTSPDKPSNDKFLSSEDIMNMIGIKVL